MPPGGSLPQRDVPADRGLHINEFLRIRIRTRKVRFCQEDVRLLLGIAVTRAASIDDTWTTVHLAHAALQRGHAVRFIEPWDFEVNEQGILVARAYAFEAPGPGPATIAADLSNRTASRRYVSVPRLDRLLLRASPLDSTLLSFARIAQRLGVEVVNDPAGLLEIHSKSWLASLAGVPTPRTLVTQSLGTASLFFDNQPHATVVKPAQGSGGRNVALIQAGDHSRFQEAFHQARGRGRHVVIQGYLPEAEHGEKRLVWMDGAVLGGYLRTRAPGEFRHNLKQGGTPLPTTVTASEHAVIARLSPFLLDAGIRFAGIDVIGDCIIEVNALNPGGAYHADRLNGTRITDTIIARLEPPPQAHAQERTPWVHPAP